jgi:cytochrome c biogenesis protein CcmG/thiol:disulfide interchange protein DsbE
MRLARRPEQVNEDAGVRFFPSSGDLSGPHTDEPNERIVIIDQMPPGRNLFVALFLAAALALAAAGCGSSSGGGDYGGKHPDYARALAGSPAPLAALHAEANRLLPGGAGAFERRIAALTGYPVVVNMWASWCGPCRFEFPTLQRLSARYGRRVAFLGVDSQDSGDAASTFLEEEPVPYPSYTDPGKEIAAALHATLGLPDTAFYDRAGRLVYLKQGPYSSHGELRSDIERYALGGSGKSG